MDFMRWRKSISIGLVNNNTDRLHGWAGTTSLITETDAQLIIPLSDKAFLYVSLTPQEPVPMLSLVRRALQVGLWWAGLGRRVVSGCKKGERNNGFKKKELTRSYEWEPHN